MNILVGTCFQSNRMFGTKYLKTNCMPKTIEYKKKKKKKRTEQKIIELNYAETEIYPSKVKTCSFCFCLFVLS